MDDKKPVDSRELLKRTEHLQNEAERKHNEMNEAMKKMATAVEKLAKPEENFSYKEGGLMTQVTSLAEAFEIMAKRIKDIDDTMVRENGPAARSLPKPKR